jgi:hypothetical protein
MKPNYWRGRATEAAGRTPQGLTAAFWAVADQPLEPPSAMI